MKNLFLTIAALGTLITTANASELIKNLYAGTEIQFVQDIQLTAARGKQHIEEGQVLIVSHVEVTPSRLIQNPVTAKNFTANPKIQIKFKGKKSVLRCRNEDALSFSVSDLESDNRIKIISPSENTRYNID
jgi:hypothetical protein